MTISKFQGEYAFLSNFYPSPIQFEKEFYSTLEHAFQAAKTLNPEEREKIRNCKSPGQAKRIGRRVTLRPNWDNIRIDVMKTLVRKKFENSDLQQLLLGTGNVELVEGNTWNDRFWGVCAGKGENHLGKILMEIRDSLLH